MKIGGEKLVSKVQQTREALRATIVQLTLQPGSLERECRLDQHATIVRRARLDSEKHIVADIGDDARRLVKRRLPSLQGLKDARTRRT
jgi:hypothetical protein